MFSLEHHTFFANFVLILCHSGGLGGRTFKQKGVIEIIFSSEILAKFNSERR